MPKDKVGADIAVIKNQLTNLSNNFEEFKNDNKKFVTDITSKVDNIDNKQVATETRVGNFALFQSVLSIIIGAIATYLGVKQ